MKPFLKIVVAFLISAPLVSATATSLFSQGGKKVQKAELSTIASLQVVSVQQKAMPVVLTTYTVPQSSADVSPFNALKPGFYLDRPKPPSAEKRGLGASISKKRNKGKYWCRIISNRSPGKTLRIQLKC